MPFQIDPLATHPELIPVLAQWHQQEWQHLNPPSYDLQARIMEYHQAVSSTALPQMWLAHNNGQALGSARLIEHDMETHPELNPWLASLYVHPEFRRQGIATRLIKKVEFVAQQLGFHRLYLYTEDRQHMYQQLGWLEQFREEYFDEMVVVMAKQLI